MSTASATVPAEADILCEGCGYVLNGLPATSNCPECGKPISESDPLLRTAPPWESQLNASRFAAFWSTTFSALRHPSLFYRSLPTRGDERKSAQFAHLHMALAGAIFGLCAILHVQWLFDLSLSHSSFFVRANSGHVVLTVLFIVGCVLLGYVAMVGISWIAARLTSLEARYWGLRLPLPTVRRVMQYHTADYLPVALLTLLTVGGYTTLRNQGTFSYTNDVTYLYTLCGEVIVGAVYLFRTYWIGMRNVMYANR